MASSSPTKWDGMSYVVANSPPKNLKAMYDFLPTDEPARSNGVSRPDAFGFFADFGAVATALKFVKREGDKKCIDLSPKVILSDHQRK